jgi:uncharacterized protein YndB with AHSA1/START domain
MAVNQETMKLDVSIEIAAPVSVVFAAFFDDVALGSWLHTSRTIAVARLLGPYVLEWPQADERDEVLGRLGGIFRATVMQVDPYDHLFLADAFWLPPDGGPLGPLSVQITFTPTTTAAETITVLRVVITGFDSGIRWQRYLVLARAQWQDGLTALKRLLEV